MFFLVPYHLIDRNDLSLIQKMCILYLARHYDEKGASAPISELEMAEKLRVSTSEVRLNLEVLVSKGIIDIDNELLEVRDEKSDGKEIIVKEAIFKDLNLDEFEDLKNKLNNRVPPSEAERFDALAELTEADAFKDEAVVLEEARGAGSPAPDRGEKDGKKAEFEKDYDEVLAMISSAEERIRERASRLKLNVRRERRERSGREGEAEAERNPQYNRRKSDREALERRQKAQESEELLQMLSESNKSLKEETKSIEEEQAASAKRKPIPQVQKPDSEEGRKRVNTRFMQASSVYRQSNLSKRKPGKKKSDDIEV